MKITDILNSKVPSISFEVFPPKETARFDDVLSTVDQLSLLRPDYMSVTYGAGGGTAKKTASVAGHMENKLGITALAHMTCVSSTRADIDATIDELKKHGVGNILALRGDYPRDMEYVIEGSYKYASELIGDIRARGDFCIGGACYPDGHVECENKEDDIYNLKKKVDAGCEFLVTQLFFDNNVLYNFLYRLFQHNIRVPVVAGIMPVTNLSTIKRMAKLSGAVITPKYKAMLDRFGHSPEALRQAGVAYAIEQIIDLIAGGVKGIHIYTMNRPEIAAEIMRGISHIVSRA